MLPQPTPQLNTHCPRRSIQISLHLLKGRIVRVGPSKMTSLSRRLKHFFHQPISAIKKKSIGFKMWIKQNEGLLLKQRLLISKYNREQSNEGWWLHLILFLKRSSSTHWVLSRCQARCWVVCTHSFHSDNYSMRQYFDHLHFTEEEKMKHTDANTSYIRLNRYSNPNLSDSRTLIPNIMLHFAYWNVNMGSERYLFLILYFK